MGLTHSEPDRPPNGPAVPPTLDDADPTRRREAVHAHAPGDVTELIPLVGHENDPVIREAALTEIVESGDAGLIATLVPYLGSQDAGLRLAVVDALIACPEIAVGVVTPVLGDADPHMRILAVMVLAGVHHPDVVDALRHLLETESHPNVAAAALDVFLPLAQEADDELLQSVSRRFADDPFLRFVLQPLTAPGGGR